MSFFSTITFIHDSDYFCYIRIKRTATVTVQLNHYCLLTVIWTVLSRRVIDARAAANDTQRWDVFVFHQDNAPAHQARDTVELLRC